MLRSATDLTHNANKTAAWKTLLGPTYKLKTERLHRVN